MFILTLVMANHSISVEVKEIVCSPIFSNGLKQIRSHESEIFGIVEIHLKSIFCAMVCRIQRHSWLKRLPSILLEKTGSPIELLAITKAVLGGLPLSA